MNELVGLMVVFTGAFVVTNLAVGALLIFLGAFLLLGNLFLRCLYQA